MNLRQFIFIILLSLLGLQIVNGQEKPKAILQDQFGKGCNEAVMTSIAGFVSLKTFYPKSSQFIIFYGSENDEGGNLSLIEWFKFYSKGNGFELPIIRGANQKEPQTEFWFVPEGAEPPKPKSAFVPPVFNHKIRFDLADAFIEPGSKGDLQHPHSEFGCQLPPNRKEFAKILLQNNNLQGLIIVDNQSRSTATKVANIIVHQLTKTYKVSRNRFRVTYRHKSEYGEAELWLIPKRRKS